MKLQYKRFSRPLSLKSIRRELLTQFFGSFKSDFEVSGISLPPPDADDINYFGSVARLLASPETLPARVNEALFAIDELANAEGQERIESAVGQADPPFQFLAGSSHADLAVQVWLASPELLARAHNCQRLRRLSTFAHFGSEPGALPPPSLRTPDPNLLSEVAAALDPWFTRHHRGHHTTRVEHYLIEDHHWFLVRHGDTFSRTAAVEAQSTHILHYRPERDDVIIHAPEHDELWINARTKGERELYVREFGQLLRGRPDYFSRRSVYTLEPLRTRGPEAIAPLESNGIEKITLREIEVMWDERGKDVVTYEAEDLFERRSENMLFAQAIPDGGRFARASFEFHFRDQPRARLVQIRLPNILKLGRHCDLRAVNNWLTERGFRVTSQRVES